MADSNDGSFTFIPVDWRCKPAQEAIRVHIMRRRHRQARRDQKTPQARRYKRQSGEEIHLWSPLDDHSGRSEDWLGYRCESFSSSRTSPESLPLDFGQAPGDGHGGLRLYSSPFSPASSGNLNSVISPPVPSPSDVEAILLQHCKVPIPVGRVFELTMLRRSSICRRVSDHSSASTSLP